MTNIAFVDCETTGLDPHNGHYLLEIAVLVTDKDLNILDEVGYQSVVKYDPLAAIIAQGRANDYVTEMHAKTGLWDKLTGPGAKHLEQIDREIAAYLAKFGEPKTMPVGGNSVRLDQNFIEFYLPLTYAHLDYHVRDVSTVAALAEGWYGQDNFVKVNDHTAMTDIRESIRELRHYRDTVFMPFPETNDEDGRFLAWYEAGRKAGWISESVCISHDMVPMTPDEQDDDEPCVHVLRLYPDAETKRRAEADDV